MGALRAVLEVLVRILVPLVAFDIGMSTSLRDLRKELRSPAFWRGLFVALLVVPALAVAVAKALPLTPVGRVVLVLMAVCPGAPRMATHVRQRGGNVALACSLAAGLALVSVLVVPVELSALNALFPLALHVSPLALVRRLGPELVVPLVLGLAVLAARPTDAARLEPAVRAIVRVVTALVATAILVIGVRRLGDVRISAWVAMILFAPAALLLGHALGGPDRRDRHTVAYTVILGNPAVALLVARSSYPGLDLAPAIVAYVILRSVAAVPYDLAISRRSRVLAHR
jgi:BASS family bile acid:Na+ symporter